LAASLEIRKAAHALRPSQFIGISPNFDGAVHDSIECFSDDA